MHTLTKPPIPRIVFFHVWFVYVGKCPSPKTSRLCHMGLKNLCSNDTDCNYIDGGVCCFDGCRRRCATSDSFPDRLESKIYDRFYFVVVIKDMIIPNNVTNTFSVIQYFIKFKTAVHLLQKIELLPVFNQLGVSVITITLPFVSNLNHKSLGTLLLFWGVFQFTQVQPLPSSHKQCWTRVFRSFSEFQICIGWGVGGELQEDVEKDTLF